jgi:hypothetical protein
MRRATALLGLFAALAVLHTWPLASDVSSLSRLDNDDAGLNIFIVSWIAHILPRAPLALFDAPMFFPERATLAYSEHMLVPSLMGAPLIWAGVSPVTVYNLLVMAGFALSGWTMALVVRRWTGSTQAGVLSGMLYAFNAHLLTRLVHLQALHLEFLPIALFALDAVLRTDAGNRQPAAGSREPAIGNRQSAVGSDAGTLSPSSPSAAPALSAPSAALTSAFVLQALCSNYTLVFMSAALFVAAVARYQEWLWPIRVHRVRALALSALASVALLAPFLWPYYVVSREQGLTRSIEEVALYSAGWADYLATGGRLHYEWWSRRWFDGRTALFPGVAALTLAVAAVFMRDTRRDPRVRMILTMGAAGFALSFGPALPGYAWLHAHVPLFEGLRAAARWGILPLTAIAVIAGFTLAEWQRRWGHSTYWNAACVLVLAVATLESLRAPMAFSGVPQIPALYEGLAAETGAVLVEIPMYGGASVSENAQYLLHSTRHFRPLVNGYSGFESDTFRQRAARWRAFPASDVLRDMAALGVTHIVVHTRELAPGELQATAESPHLELLRDDDGFRLYRLRP